VRGLTGKIAASIISRVIFIIVDPAAQKIATEPNLCRRLTFLLLNFVALMIITYVPAISMVLLQH